MGKGAKSGTIDQVGEKWEKNAVFYGYGFVVICPHSTISKSSPVDLDLSRSPNSNLKMKLHLKVIQKAPCI
jgi:hypothetical protein